MSTNTQQNIGGGFAPKIFGLRAVLENAEGGGAGAAPPAPAAAPPAPAAAPPSPPAAPPPPAPPAPPAAAAGPALTPAELTQLQADAKAHRDTQAAALAAIEARKATLPEAARAAIDAAETLKGKQAVLALIDSAPGTPAKQVHNPPASPGAPAPGGPIDFAEAFKSPDAWAAAKAKDPQGASTWLATSMSSGRRPSTLDRMRTKPAAKSA